MTLESDILAEIKPTPEECAEILSKAARLQALAEQYLRDNGIEAKVRFVGSVGKGTYLRNPDIDLFLIFPESVSREDMERQGLRAGKDLIGGELMYAEHPYTSGSFEGLDVDLVPCFQLSSTEHMRTAVDRTPFHADYILSHSDDAMKDEIRLMKQFMKGIGVYGAEPNVRGFSGYLCEIMTIRFGGFLETVKAASKWRPGKSVWLEEKGEPMKGALVFYDPVDKRRNVASAVHEDTFSAFVTACRAYLSDPRREFFFPNKRIPESREALLETWKSRGTGLVSVTFPRPDIIAENLYAQVWRSYYGLKKKLGDFDFRVLKGVHCVDEKEVHIVFELSQSELPPLHIHDGPPVHVDNASNFLERWKDNPYGRPFIEDGTWKVMCEVPYANAADMLEKETRQAGLGKDIRPESMTVCSQDAVIEMMDPLALTELFDHRFPWEN